jgi:uncharacterized protein
MAALWLCLVGAGSVGAQIPDAPKPARLCNDFSGTLSAQEIQLLESKLDSFDRETSVQICLVVVPDLGGFDVSDYATRLFEKWGIGRAKQDDGVLLLLALQERKIRIETGYGLESVITDALSRRLIEQKIAPALRSGGVAEGLRAGSTGLMNLVRGDYQDLEARPEGEKGEPIGGSALFWILLALILLLILSKRGGGGGQGVGRDGTRGFGGPFWVPGGGFGGGGGGFGGGGFGGFGGFGGGMSGGGGASGSW